MTNTAKPSWDDAPSWANYLAQDEDGTWWWYKSKPNALTTTWKNDDHFSRASLNEHWKETLEKRPSPITSIWDLLPQEVKYIAMDMNGAWYGYKDKPHVGKDGMWCIDADEVYAKMLDGLISFDGSLIQRPD